MEYNIKVAGLSDLEMMGDYKLFGNELNENIIAFVNKFNIQNEKTKKYKGLVFQITPEKGINTIFLTTCYFNKYKCNIFIPELRNKEDNLKEILKVLKSEYKYNKKQIELFEIFYKSGNQNGLINIISSPNPHNLLSVLWFGEKNNNIHKQIINSIKANIGVYDIYNLETLKKEYIEE